MLLPRPTSPFYSYQLSCFIKLQISRFIPLCTYLVELLASLPPPASPLRCSHDICQFKYPCLGTERERGGREGGREVHPDPPAPHLVLRSRGGGGRMGGLSRQVSYLSVKIFGQTSSRCGSYYSLLLACILTSWQFI